MMLTPLWIAMWAWLFCGPLSESGQVFGWLKNRLYTHVVVKSRLTVEQAEAAMKVLIDCPKCHAGQIAFWWQVASAASGNGFSIPFILCSIFLAIVFEDMAALIDKWKNA